MNVRGLRAAEVERRVASAGVRLTVDLNVEPVGRADGVRRNDNADGILRGDRRVIDIDSIGGSKNRWSVRSVVDADLDPELRLRRTCACGRLRPNVEVPQTGRDGCQAKRGVAQKALHDGIGAIGQIAGWGRKSRL